MRTHEYLTVTVVFKPDGLGRCNSVLIQYIRWFSSVLLYPFSSVVLLGGLGMQIDEVTALRR